MLSLESRTSLTEVLRHLTPMECYAFCDMAAAARWANNRHGNGEADVKAHLLYILTPEHERTPVLLTDGEGD